MNEKKNLLNYHECKLLNEKANDKKHQENINRKIEIEIQ